MFINIKFHDPRSMTREHLHSLIIMTFQTHQREKKKTKLKPNDETTKTKIYRGETKWQKRTKTIQFIWKTEWEEDQLRQKKVTNEEDERKELTWYSNARVSWEWPKWRDIFMYFPNEKKFTYDKRLKKERKRMYTRCTHEVHADRENRPRWSLRHYEITITVVIKSEF